ncbi:UDP-N-acetylglucosamine 1-carboxyvinyltransferase [Brevundimonas sp. 2R-24]|uniref:UDP-N-acetylglucosamine 1-carboxyvinyltransferase n=1 Tax=Peiella sedimenti TaxID=3061083 RepID=A0ABT8SPE9_9CAUL|nr:UDP-N-acetylglucosamine 1-carboxyvinyltransferase [Caulobacteraceae bacterium XZ-24]
MDRIVIEGGAALKGTLPVSGAKNSAIKLMVACLLTEQPLTLRNMPDLADTRFLTVLLQRLGVKVTREADVMILDGHDVSSAFAPYALVRKMRASFNVLGPLLARMGHAKVSLPGGCAIGARPVDLHLQALEALGANLEMHEGYVYATAPRGLKGAEITFPFVSVGATEHALLSAVLARGTTVLRNAAREPEIGDLAHCLNAMGAKISGIDTDTLIIEGVKRLSGADWSVIPDRIEAGTFACVAAMTGGEVVVDRVRVDTLQALIAKLREAGVEVEEGEASVTIRRDPSTRLKAVDVTTEVYPGFPTDVQAQFMAVMTLAEGESVIRETIFENRFMHAPELSRLGARIAVHGGEARVTGVEALHGAPVMATDLRASVSLVIAGLAAEGRTEISRVYHLDRGFERLEEKLAACGARIWREEGDGDGSVEAAAE